MTMSQVSSLIERESEDSISRREYCEKYRKICWRTRKWLDIYIFSPEKCFCSLYSEIFCLVDKLLSSIVTLSWVAF